MLKKLILGFILFVVLIVVVGVFLVATLLNRGIKTGVETYGPKITGTGVAIDRVDLSPLSGNGVLEGLEIRNPEGFGMANAFTLGRIEVDVELTSLLSDKIVVNRIHITEPKIYFERKIFVGSNLGALLENIAEALSKLVGEDEEESTGGPMLQISEFILEKGSITVGVAGRGVTVPMDDVRMSDLGTDEDGVSAGEVVREIMVVLLGNVTLAATIAAKGAVKGGVGGAEAVIDSGRNDVRAAGDVASEAVKNIGGLFRKKE